MSLNWEKLKTEKAMKNAEKQPVKVSAWKLAAIGEASRKAKTKWEVEFVQGIEARTHVGKGMSPRQAAIFKKILKRRESCES